MSETITLTQLTTLSLPADILLRVILALLAPLFLSATNGDHHLAKMAALETLNAYRVRNQAELLAVAQIIAFGLAALSSIRLSSADDLPLPMTLRLRRNAVSLDRAAKQHSRTLQQPVPGNQQPQQNAAGATPNPDRVRYEAEVLANVAASQKLTAEAVAGLQTAAQSPAQQPPAQLPPAQAATRQPTANQNPAEAAIQRSAAQQHPVQQPPAQAATQQPPAEQSAVQQPPARAATEQPGVHQPPAQAATRQRPTQQSATQQPPDLPTSPVPPTSAIPPASAPKTQAPTPARAIQTAAAPVEQTPVEQTPVTDEQWQTLWASAMTDVAAEFTAELDQLSPEERLKAFHRAAALSNCATELLARDQTKRPRPGDLDILMRSAKG